MSGEKKRPRSRPVTVTYADGTQEMRSAQSFRPEGKRRCTRCGDWIKRPKGSHRKWYCAGCLADVRLTEKWSKPM